MDSRNTTARCFIRSFQKLIPPTVIRHGHQTDRFGIEQHRGTGLSKKRALRRRHAAGYLIRLIWPSSVKAVPIGVRLSNLIDAFDLIIGAGISSPVFVARTSFR